MKRTSLLCFILIDVTWADISTVNIGICDKIGTSGSLVLVCCADFENRHGSCQPCPTGYTSLLGQMCTPCPVNTHGETCLHECDCNQFQRCDNVEGCVNSITTEAPTEAHQTSNSVLNEIQTTSWSHKASSYDIFMSLDFQTSSRLYSTYIPDKSNPSGSSLKEGVVYYILSLGFVIIVVCLCFAFAKYIRRRKTQTINIRIMRHETTDQIRDNNERSEIEDIYVYEEINEDEMIEGTSIVSTNTFELTTDVTRCDSNGPAIDGISCGSNNLTIESSTCGGCNPLKDGSICIIDCPLTEGTSVSCKPYVSET